MTVLDNLNDTVDKKLISQTFLDVFQPSDNVNFCQTSLPSQCKSFLFCLISYSHEGMVGNII